MEAVPPVRSSLSGTLLLVVKLSTLLVQNRAHLYNFLLLKIFLFNHWLSGLIREAQGSHPPPRLGLSAATWTDLFLSCLHSLMLAALLLLLLVWRLYRKAQCCSLGWLPRKVGEGGTTCLASHLLQAAFEHTAQLAQAQEAEPQKALGLSPETPPPGSPAPEARPVLPEPGE
ncbi:hypothetical protein K5549_010551 [Capra hircus]|nr:hypothetical protein K5549_010551 [Capra hircus]